MHHVIEAVTQTHKDREREIRERKRRVVTGQINMRDPADVAELKRMQNERTANFKNTLSRYEVPAYQILAGVPVNANEGMHNPDFGHVDKKEKMADFNYRTPQKVNPRLHHVPPAVQGTLECTYESRVKAKRNMSQQFNSLNLVE